MRTIVIPSLVVAIAGSASAFTLNDRNASAEFAAGGMEQVSFSIDGTEQLASQSFFIQLGGGGVVDLASVAYATASTINADFDAGDEVFEASQQVDDFLIEYRITINGGLPGSNNATMAVFVDVTNNGNSAEVMQFIQFADFNLSGSANDQSVVFLNDNTVIQDDGALVVEETATTPQPDSWQVGLAADVLAAASAGSLDNTLDGGPGDLAWALAWDRTLAAGQTFQLSKAISIEIPTPGTMALIGLAGLAVAKRRR